MNYTCIFKYGLYKFTLVNLDGQVDEGGLDEDVMQEYGDGAMSIFCMHTFWQF